MNKHGKKLQINKQQSIQVSSKVNTPLLNNDDIEKNSYSFEQSMNLNVREHIDKLFDILYKIKDELKVKRDDMNIIQEELSKMRSNQFKVEENITTDVCSEVNRIKNTIKKASIETHQTYVSLNMQVSTLHNEKDFIESGKSKVDLQTNMVETHVGFRRVYD